MHVCRERERIAAATSKREWYFLDTASEITFAKVGLVFRHWSYTAVFVIKVRWLVAVFTAIVDCIWSRHLKMRYIIVPAAEPHWLIGILAGAECTKSCPPLASCEDAQRHRRGKDSPCESPALHSGLHRGEQTPCSAFCWDLSVCPLVFCSHWFVMLSNRS